MHSAGVADWRAASAPSALTAIPSTSTSYCRRYSRPPFISTRQHRYAAQYYGPTIRLRGAHGNRQRTILKRKDVFSVSGHSMQYLSGSSGSEIRGTQLGERPGQAFPQGWRSWKRLPVSVALQQDGAREIAPALKPKTIEIDSLPPFVRDSTMKAVDELGRRVTVGDVASRAGLKLTQAETALQALAADSGGFLEVSDEGDVLYVLPKDYRSNLTSKSLRMKYEPLLEKLKTLAEYAIRVSFGTALLASIVIVYTTILVLLSSGGRSDDDNRGNRGGYQSQRYNNPGFSVYISPADLFWYWNPNYNMRRRPSKRGGGRNFFENVFSFVFGDGDPNEGLEEARWRSIGDMISSKGGVVSAEELAPYLDVPPYSEETKADESFVLPVLLRFDGHPEVDEQGNILYRFPSLQRTAVDWLGRRKVETKEETGGLNYFSEKQWNFSKASKVEQTLVIGLGALNLAGVVILSSMLRDYSLIQSLRGSGLIPFAAKALPFLQAYTASFFAIPAFRWFQLQRRNAEIEQRNRARLGWVAALDRAGTELRQKLKSARDLAKRTVLGRDRIIYSTEKDLSNQEYEAQDWERRLKERK